MTLDEELTCPACGVVVAHAAHRRFPPLLELHCRNDHRTLRTVPQVVRAMRHSPGAWVDLGSGR